MQDAREKLLKAALELMADGGSAAVSIAGACRAAGLSRRTAYNHFGDRASLVRAAKSRLEAQLLEATRREVPANAYLLVAEAAAEDDAFLRSQIHDALEQGARRNKTLRAIIEQFQTLEQEGRLRKGTDPEMAATISFGSWLGAVLAVSLARGKRDKAEIAQRFAKELERSMAYGVFEPDDAQAAEAPRNSRREPRRRR